MVPRNGWRESSTPIAEVTTGFDSIYPCDGKSVIKELSYQTKIHNSRVTCNGVIVSRDDHWYDAVLWNPHYKGKKDRLILTNYTLIISANNGII